MIMGAGAMIFVLVASVCIWASRYTKVGPNHVLIVSGRAHQLADGRRIGYRIVKGGGTFVFPVIEKVDVLSLEVMTIDAIAPEVKTLDALATVDYAAQLKIKGDDASIAVASEHFLSKTQLEMNQLMRPILAKHLNHVLCNSTLENVKQHLATYAAEIELAAAGELDAIGIKLLSFSLQRVRAK